MKCLPSWPNHCEVVMTSVKAATEVAVLALYSEPETVPNLSVYGPDHNFQKQ